MGAPTVSRRYGAITPVVLWVAVGFALSVATLIWLGYRSATNWRDSAAIVARQSTEVGADLLFTTVTRDMRAVQSNVLFSLARASDIDAPTMVLDVIVSAFARYPYPEVFFVKGSPEAQMLLYGRTERPPAWLEIQRSEQMFPVTVGRNPTVSRQILGRVSRDVDTSQQFSAFDVALREHRDADTGHTYQVIALITYDDLFREKARSIVGFMVDLDLIRRAYVPNLLAQVSRTTGPQHDVTFTIVDDREQHVAGEAFDAQAPMSRRSFPLLFMAPTIIARGSLPGSAQAWTAIASASDASALRAAETGSRQALAVSIAAAFIMIVAVVVSVRTARARTQLIEMRSDFISAVTHELKTPIAGLRALMDMLASDRVNTAEVAKEYARLAVGEIRRLGRLADNLLAYARVTDVAEIYRREPVDIGAVVTECLQHFWPQLTADRFEQHIEIPAEVPLVSADRAAMNLVFSNLVDNAIRYSGEVRDLTIRISCDTDTQMLLVEVADKGVGIEEHDIPELTQRFFRSTQAHPGGAGLGLAIAHRIVWDHRGSMAIRSAKGAGTTVTVALPVA